MLKKLLLTAAIVAGGCYTEADVSTGYGGGNPDLVEVDGTPGVSVVADADYPVFFSDGFYWRYDGGVWYSSASYGRGWVVSRNVPVRVRGISNPGAYVHYRATLAREGRRPVPVARTEVRDHRVENTRRVEPARRVETNRRAEPTRRVEPARKAEPKAAPKKEERHEK
jgi:hypothetical protein